VDGRSTGPTTRFAGVAVPGVAGGGCGAGDLLDVSESPRDRGGCGGVRPWVTARTTQVAPDPASSTLDVTRLVEWVMNVPFPFGQGPSRFAGLGCLDESSSQLVIMLGN
jgi:hypothetical protein